MKLTLLYRRRWWLMYLPVLACAAAALWWSATAWQKLPPQRVMILAGTPQGGYARMAQRYAEQLERQGLSAEIVYSATRQAALGRLGKPGGSAAFAFAQGAEARPGAPLQALAVIGQEPVWMFAGPTGPSSLAMARGLRLAIGPALSSSYRAAQALLAQAGLSLQDVHIDSAAGLAAANALLDGQVDMVFEVAGEDAPAVQLLNGSSAVHLLGTEHARTLTMKHPGMHALLLPQGAIELRGDVPPRDLTVMSLQTHLVVASGAHPALQRAVLDAAVSLHERPGFLQRHGQFPSFAGSDFTLSPEARSYSQGERPWLENMLPYGKAQWATLILYAVLPILALAMLLLAWIPRMFDWRIHSALNNFYGELKFLENEIDRAVTDKPMALRGLLERLDHIEQQVSSMDLPAAYSERWYTLREHLAAARDRLLRQRAR